MARAPTDIRSLARSHTHMAIKILAGIAKDGTNEGARVSAAVALLDRGWGKPSQTHTGADGEGDIQITVRTFVEGVGGHAGEQRALKHVKQIDHVQSEDER